MQTYSKVNDGGFKMGAETAVDPLPNGYRRQDSTGPGTVLLCL